MTVNNIPQSLPSNYLKDLTYDEVDDSEKNGVIILTFLGGAC